MFILVKQLIVMTTAALDVQTSLESPIELTLSLIVLLITIYDYAKED